MSRKKDTDYLSISARIRVLETRLLTRERLERMIDAPDDAQALKVLEECGYAALSVSDPAGLERALSASREALFGELSAAVPDSGVVDIFRVKYDYHNAKVLLKAEATGQDARHLLVFGGRYAPEQLAERPDTCGAQLCAAMEQGRQILKETGDPQQADLQLDRAYFAEMGQLAKQLGSAYMQGYVRLMTDAANLRCFVRCMRLEKGPDFLAQALLDGGSVSVFALSQCRAQDVGALFSGGLLASAANLAVELAKPGACALTELERVCDDALMAYQERARRTPFGEEVVAGYLFARESELTAIRTVMAGRMAGLDGDALRRRLRATYL